MVLDPKEAEAGQVDHNKNSRVQIQDLRNADAVPQGVVGQADLDAPLRNTIAW